MKPLAIVVAVADNGVIGKDGKLPWRIPEDLKHFRRLTEGHAVIMGRRTFEERGKPLPDRRNLIVSSSLTNPPAGIEVVPTLGEAIERARETDPEPRVIGGREMFREALPLVTTLYLTHVHQRPEGDVSFPEVDLSRFRVAESREGDGVTYVTYVR